MSDKDQSKKINLGRGLASLLGEAGEVSIERTREDRSAPIEALHPSGFQPRQYFEPEGLEELATSIAERGILQPILVRQHPVRSGDYEIVAGERRWRAAQLAKLDRVPIVVRELDDSTALELAIVENIQRQDLTALEEAEGYRRLIEEFDYSQEKLAQMIGKSRPHIANTLRLLSLPDSIKTLVQDGQLSAGHGRALLSAAQPEVLAKQVLAKGLSVRETERLASAKQSDSREQGTKSPAKSAKVSSHKDADTLALERDLSDLLGLEVKIDIDGDGGKLTINYTTLEQLDDILKRLNQAPGQ